MSQVDVYLGLGSNIERERHILAALDALAQDFGTLECSPVFESEPVGIRSDCFYNLVVHVRTALGLSELIVRLKAIEAQEGRLQAGPRELPLDIDVLLYGDLVGEFAGIRLPRPHIMDNAHVLWPLSLLAPDLLHPGGQNSFAQLWTAHSASYRLWPAALCWNGRPLTPLWMLDQPANKQGVLQPV